MAVNLDDLSNDEIRIRLQQYGFANLPVTQTTRKVLVKKLKNAMENEKAKNRRETIAVVKSSDDEDIPDPKKREKTPNRRATIAVTEKTKKVPASSSSAESIPELPAPKTTSRRSTSRATPVKDPKPVVSSTENVINESDDDIVEINTYTRRSKTPTMTKSETVRTSYKNQVETISDPIPEKKRFVEEVVIQPKIPIQTATRRKTAYTSTTTEQFELPPRIDTPTKFGKTSLTTSYNPTTNYRFEKEKEKDEDYEFDEEETPYLSNFAKRLSTLKAEPLDASIKSKSTSAYTEYRSSNDNYSSVPATSYKYSQYGSSSSYQPAVKRPGVVNQMAKDFNTMDRKYSVRKYVYITLIIMLIIAIYVLLFL
jgi:membrane protein Man1